MWRGLQGRRAQQYIAEKLEEQGRRHQKYGGSVYLQEPNVKEGPGGLRDFHVAVWVARARHRLADLADLSSLNLLTPVELGQCVQALDFLLRVRSELHYLQAGKHDVLSLAVQVPVAASLGFLRRPEVRGRAVHAAVLSPGRGAPPALPAGHRAVRRAVRLPRGGHDEEVAGSGYRGRLRGAQPADPHPPRPAGVLPGRPGPAAEDLLVSAGDGVRAERGGQRGDSRPPGSHRRRVSPRPTAPWVSFWPSCAHRTAWPRRSGRCTSLAS